MRTACCFLFLTILCIQSSLQLEIHKGSIDSENKTEISINNDTLFRTRNEVSKKNEISKKSKGDLNTKKLQELLKQAANSTLNGTNQVTATKQGPCQCGGGVCSCCSRILYDTWKQKACVNVSYDPDEFSFTAKVSMNDRLLYTRTVSGKFMRVARNARECKK